MDNFFNNQNNNVNKNEELLDEIMEKQKKRDEKNISKGYLLKNDKKQVSVFKQADVQNDDDNVTNIFVADNYEHQNRGEPMFVINDKKTSKKFKGKNASQNTTYNSYVSPSKKPFNAKKLGIFILCCFLFALAFVGVVAAIIFTEDHAVELTCGYLDGIIIQDQKGSTVSNINLKLNQSFTFKVVVKVGYENDSEVYVTFNDKNVPVDVNGFYTIKNTNNVLKLHIGGIRPNQFNVNLNNSRYYLRDRNNQVLDLTDKQFKTNDILTFRVVNSLGDNIETNTFSVYFNNALQTAGSDRFYNIKLISAGEIKILPHSAYEFFNFEESKEGNNKIYNIIGLTSLGARQETIYFPDKYNDCKAYIRVDEKLSYPMVKTIGVPSATGSIEPKNFNAFISLEKFKTFSCYGVGVLHATDNGILTSTLVLNKPGNKEERTSIYVIPQSLAATKLEFIKSEQLGSTKQIFIFSKNCFYNLNTVKQVTINADDVIFADGGFNEVANKNSITFNITSKTYKTTTDGKTILKADESGSYTILFGVPYYNTKYEIPEGVTKIGSNAFANTKITGFDFSKVTSLTLEKYAFAKLTEVETIKLPSFITSIPDNCFNECAKLTSIDLTELDSAIAVSTSSFEGCYNTDIKIFVKADLLEAFKTANPNIAKMFDVKK